MDFLILRSHKTFTECFWWHRRSEGLLSNLLLQAGLAAKPEQVGQCLAQLSCKISTDGGPTTIPGPVWCMAKSQFPSGLLPVASCMYKVLISPRSSSRYSLMPLPHLLQGDQNHSPSGHWAPNFVLVSPVLVGLLSKKVERKVKQMC